MGTLIMVLIPAVILSVFAVKITDWTRRARRAFKLKITPLVIAYLAGLGTGLILVVICLMAH